MSSISNRIHQLAAPPRRVPLRLQCSVLLGITGGIGAIFLITGLIVTLVFGGPIVPINDLLLSLLPTSTTEGTITAVSGTSTTVNDVPVYRYDFMFYTPEGTELSGTSYITGYQWSPESHVTIEYTTDHPQVARIQDARTSLLPPLVAPLMLIFPLTGAFLFAGAVRSGWQHIRLLQYGEVSSAQNITATPTNTTINDVPVMAYTYEFQDSAGVTYNGTSRSLPKPQIGDESEEPVLYLPWAPDHSVLVDALTLRRPIEIDEFGQWITQVSIWPVIWCGITFVSLLGITVFAVLRLFESVWPFL